MHWRYTGKEQSPLVTGASRRAEDGLVEGMMGVKCFVHEPNEEIRFFADLREVRGDRPVATAILVLRDIK